MNGYQLECSGTPGSLDRFRSTFGVAEEILQRDGRATLFFDNCSLVDKPPIENLAVAFAELLGRLRYESGQPVPQVDVVAHSMGGLVVRSYLAGKQTNGTFTPPVDVRIRKAIFLGTPHFGTSITSLFPGNNAQIEQLTVGSGFLFDLATWNQGIDDLRGVDSITVLGNAGSDLLGRLRRFDDSTVTLTSGSLDFVMPGRTRILNFCHTSGLADLLCVNDKAGYLAQMTSATHESARAVVSFLNDTSEWSMLGESPQNNTHLSRGGGLAVRWRDANDSPLTIQSATLPEPQRIAFRSSIAYSELLPAQPLQLTLRSTAGAAASVSLPPFSGGSRTFTVKAGPSIAAVLPSAALIFPRSVAPGMFVSIYGTALSAGTGQAPGLPYPTTLVGTEVRLGGVALPLHFASPGQVNAVIPESASGLARLTVKSPVGEHTVNVLIEPAVPALFNAALNAVTGVLVTDNVPLRPGDYVSLFLTGLGATERRENLDWAKIQPQVTIGGKPCELLYAGRAPGYIGLDQINCRLAADLAANNVTAVSVRSGSRTSNVVNLPVR